MKKIIGITTIIIMILNIVLASEEKIIIPKDSIRFRVIANSNTEIDQQEKRKIAKSLGKNITETLKDTNSLEEARLTLQKNEKHFTNIIEKQLKEDHSPEEVKVNYGMNYFPEKEYKGVKYEEGEYESLVVTLGKGEGKNFWCVLFPPLCLLEAEEEETSQVEYTSFIKEVIDKYF